MRSRDLKRTRGVLLSAIGVTALLLAARPLPAQTRDERCLKPPENTYTSKLDASLVLKLPNLLPALRKLSGEVGISYARKQERLDSLLPGVTTVQQMEQLFCDMWRRRMINKRTYDDYVERIIVSLFPPPVPPTLTPPGGRARAPSARSMSPATAALVARIQHAITLGDHYANRPAPHCVAARDWIDSLDVYRARFDPAEGAHPKVTEALAALDGARNRIESRCIRAR